MELHRHSRASLLALSFILLLLTGCSSLPKFSASRNREPKEAGVKLRAIDSATQAEACRLTALELAAHQKDEHAIAQFERARKLNPQLKGIAHPLAVLYDRQGRLDAAQREYEKALVESPRNPDVHNDFGYFLYTRGHYETARKHLSIALTINSGHEKARLNLAMLFCAEGDFDAAFREFERAVGPAAAHHNVAMLQLKAGRREEAIAHLSQAAQSDPSLGSAGVLTALANQSGKSAVILPASFQGP